MHETKDRKMKFRKCARIAFVVLVVGAALWTVHLVTEVSSRPARAWECEIAGGLAQAGTILVSPTLSTMGVGESVTVTVWLSDVADYYGLDFHLQFDPSVVTTTRITPRWDLFDAGYNYLITDVLSDEVHYVVSNMRPAQPFTGTGRVCDIVFEALAPGTSTLHFDYALGSTQDIDPLYPTKEDGEIEVTAGETFELTPTFAIENTPYAIQVYTLTLANNSTTVDTFDFTHEATDTSALPPGPPATNEWVVVSETDQIIIQAGLSATLHITIEIPMDEIKDVTHTLTFTATSQNSGSSAKAVLRTSTGGPAGCRFDLGRSGMVNIFDLRAVLEETGNINPFLDFGHSGMVNIFDLRKILEATGTPCTQ